MNKRTLGAIILAAGRGSRMKLKNGNKTSLLLNGKPLISYPVELLAKLKINPVVVVVGHAKDSVREALKNADVLYVTQKKRLGTGHAVKIAISGIPGSITDILVMNGDDSYSYKEDIITKMVSAHFKRSAALTMLTLTVADPSGLGRVVRNEQGEVINIIEEKDSGPEHKLIKEINTNCYIFQMNFLKKYLPKITKSPVTGEYYLPALIKLAFDNKERIEGVAGGTMQWRGINTKEELSIAQEIFINE